jgi:O-antigen/teichoic acid export membrane protein
MDMHKVPKEGLFLRVITKLKSGSILSQIAKKAAGSFGIKVFSLGIAFMTNVFLARLLGASGYGDYIYAVTWIGFLGIPACLGLTEYLVREVAVYQTKSEWGLLRGLLLWSNRSVLLISTGVAVIAAIVGWYFLRDTNPQFLPVFWIALLSLPLTSLTGLRQGTMKGLNQVVKGDFPELLVKPLLFVGLVGGTYFWAHDRLSSTWVMGIYVISVAVAFYVGSQQLRRILPKPLAAATATYQSQVWRKGTLPFLLIVAMFTINQQTDVLMLGAIKGNDTAGIYTVLGRGSQLIQFIVGAFSAATAPTLAQLYCDQDMPQLKRVLKNSARMVLLASFGVTSFLILFGHQFLSIFGSEFTRGNLALTILSVGYLLSSFMELGGLLLLMSGNERDTATATGLTAGLNVILNALLIPQFGLEGAAAATSISLICRGLYYTGCTMRKFQIVVNPLF